MLPFMLIILRVKHHGVAVERCVETVALVIREVQVHIETEHGPTRSR